MARWNTQTIIAGTDFSGCQAVILDGAGFQSQYRGSVALSANGTPHIQRVNVGRRGWAYGVQMPYAQATLINQALTAIRAAEAARTPFRVQMTNALQALDLTSYPDYSQAWYIPGPESEGIIENVTFRFISMGLYVP